MQLHVSAGDGVPIYWQIANQVKYLVASGRLAPGGDEIPPIRVAWDGDTLDAYYYWHTTPPDMRWNLAYADGHAAFTKLTLKVGVPVMWTATYTFDRTP